MKKLNIKKVVLVTLVIALCAPFVACSNQHDDRTDLTTRTTETGLMPDMSEPNQSINTMSPDQTTETPADTTETSVAPNQTGKYTYTVYAGTEYETTLSMDVNIDDYLVDKGQSVLFFKMGQMAIDLGWYENGDPNFDGMSETSFYTYVYGDTQMVYACGDNYSSTSNSTGFPQLGSFFYHLAPIDNRDADARSAEEIKSSKQNYGINVIFGQHPESLCYYTIYNGIRVSISRDDAIVLAYVFSAAISRPGENPFYGTNLENTQSSVSENYITYVLP